MKVLIVSDATSVHTQRWVGALKEKGLDIVLYSIVPYEGDFYNSRGVKCHIFDLFNYKREKKGLLYPIRRHLQAVKDLKRVLEKEKPQLLHSHYVTSYSLIAALSGFHPHIESVWGSDVYLYPKKSPLHAAMVKFTLGKADKILSTSHVMAKETSKYTCKEMEITPFGVDTSHFRKAGTASSTIEGNAIHPEEQPAKKKFTVGSVKTLQNKYGNEYIIRAFAIVAKNNPEIECNLELVGKGPDRQKLEKLATELGVADKVHFRGFVPNNDLPQEFAKYDVACYMSNSESFGVSALEAMACECPVVASDADGFTEVIEDGVSGIIVPRRNPEAAAAAMQKFIDNPQLKEEMGKAARERVCKLYEWDSNVEQMVKIYKDLV